MHKIIQLLIQITNNTWISKMWYKEKSFRLSGYDVISSYHFTWWPKFLKQKSALEKQCYTSQKKKKLLNQNQYSIISIVSQITIKYLNDKKLIIFLSKFIIQRKYTHIILNGVAWKHV